MIFISAQPDEYYFFWQLELQIFNFKNLGINLNNVHILIGYDEFQKLSFDFFAFKQKYKNVKIYAYSDTRISKNYLSSLRPHILRKHFQKFPDLVNETFFYHDSDIIFSSLPDFESLLIGDTWYVSDTREYLDSNYITAIAGEQLFIKMCDEVGINPQLVRDNDRHAGGAQYILKMPNEAFWKAVEDDSERIFTLLSVAEREVNRMALGFENKHYIQKWCADMWALWWCALRTNRKVEIHKEMKFCWINSPISEWYTSKILHYTGGYPQKKGHIFSKVNYRLHPPYHQNFDAISKESCSYPLVQLIKQFNKQSLLKRKKLKDVSFLIPIKIDSPDRMKNICASTSFLYKNFDTTIIVMEVDQTQKINPADLPSGVKYFFKKTNNPRLFRTQVNNEMIKMASSKFIALYDADVIIPIKQINKAVNILRKGEYKAVSPYDGKFLNIDILIKEMFIKIMDEVFLEMNRSKFSISAKRSFGGCIFLNKSYYMEAGMENENLTSWGPDDIERVKRMQILGNKTVRLPGCLYHLHHERKVDSGYKDTTEYEGLILEYLNISSLNKEELINYIKNWKWIKN